jgi:hypothetical protein
MASVVGCTRSKKGRISSKEKTQIDSRESFFYAEALEETFRRSGRVPGAGKRMCQKFESGEANSTPTYVLPSRAFRIVVTLHSIDLPLFSFTICNACPTTTDSSIGNSPPSRLTDCEFVFTENFSPVSVCQRTVNPTVSVTRIVRLRSLNRK